MPNSERAQNTITPIDLALGIVQKVQITADIEQIPKNKGRSKFVTFVCTSSDLDSLIKTLFSKILHLHFIGKTHPIADLGIMQYFCGFGTGFYTRTSFLG